MSRVIDTSNPAELSTADLKYLLQRDPMPRNVRRYFEQNPGLANDLAAGLADPRPIDEQANTGTILTQLTPEQQARAVELLREEQSGNLESEDDADDDEEDEEDEDSSEDSSEPEGESEDYDEGWNNDERRAELARRELSTEGNKGELIARLLEDDASED